MGAVVVVEAAPVVELVLELRVGAGGPVGCGATFGGLVGPFELPAGLGVAGAGADVADAQGAEVAFEVGVAVGGTGR